MMTQNIINDLADALYEQYEFVNTCYPENDKQKYFSQLRSDTLAIANVIVKNSAFVDMDEFYRRAGYIGPVPFHRK